MEYLLVKRQISNYVNVYKMAGPNLTLTYKPPDLYLHILQDRDDGIP